MGTPAQIIYDLRPVTLKGFFFHATDVSYAGGHERPKREYPYVDGAGHDYTGRIAYTGTVEFLFINTIPPYNWYPDLWSQFREILEHPDPMDFDHPDLGTIRVVILPFTVRMTAQSPAGISGSFQWEEHIDNLDEKIVYLGPDIALPALAREIDNFMGALEIPYPDGTGDDALSFSQALDNLEGFAFGLKLSAQGYINNLSNTVKDVIATTEKLQGHIAWALHDHLVALWDGLEKLKLEEKLTARATQVYTVPFDTTLDRVAREVGNTVNELIGLNLTLTRSPLVPKGTRVTFFTGGVTFKSPLRPPGP
jgi:hypothetical protein